ncbi:MAG: hypothetical protein H7138_03275 [Myxococcales bacterium]|nr:hypothetical protein [Myxococcales bacterium]
MHDLEAARAFYLETIGCKQGRETSNHIDFDMFGHHVVAHLSATRAAPVASELDGHEVPVPHFGLLTGGFLDSIGAMELVAAIQLDLGVPLGEIELTELATVTTLTDAVAAAVRRNHA